MKRNEDLDNLAVLSNAATLVNEIVLRVAGEEISTSVNGERLNRGLVTDLTLATFHKELSDRNYA